MSQEMRLLKEMVKERALQALMLFCLAQLACACTPQEVRCDGRLEPINISAATPPAAPASADSLAGVP